MDKSLAGWRLLVVEDEIMILMTIEDMLTDLGCESVTVAGNVSHALMLIGRQGFDAAMLDVNLNGTKSYPIADALAAINVPFAFSTGYSEHGMHGHVKRPMLRKPYQLKDIAKVMTELLPLRTAAH